MQYALIIVSFVLQVFLFIALGTLLLTWLGKKPNGASYGIADTAPGGSNAQALLSGDPVCTYIVGYAAWFTLFEVISLPCIFLGVKTHILSRICIVLALLIFAAFFVCLRRTGIAGSFSISALKSAIRSHGIWILIPLLLIVFFCLWQILYSDASVDAMYYLSVSNTAVYTDHLGWFNPTTGEAVRKFTPRYIFNTFPFYHAVSAVVFRLNSILQARVIMPALSALAIVLIWYRTGCALLRNQRRRYADLFLLFVFLLLLRGSSQYLQGSLMLKRLYEGKALIANLAVPMVLCIGIEYWNGMEDKASGVLFFLCSGMAVCFSGSCIILLAEIPAAVLPALLRHKRLKGCFSLLAGVFPILCWCACYYLAEKGILPMQIRR